MYKIFLAAVIAFASGSPALAAQRNFIVTDFERIQVQGPYRVKLVTGKASSARATGSPQAIDRLSVKVEGRTLRIRPSSSAWGGYPGDNGGSADIELSTHMLRSAVVSGPGALAIDKVRGMQFELSLAGSGQIGVGTIEADALVVNQIGSGRIVIGGRAKTLRADVRGAGNLEAESLTAVDARLIAETAGTVRVGASRSANIISSGTGDVEIIGTPACTVKASGSGRVQCTSR